MNLLELLIVAGAGYWLYRKGALSSVGLTPTGCPSGTTPSRYPVPPPGAATTADCQQCWCVDAAGRAVVRLSGCC